MLKETTLHQAHNIEAQDFENYLVQTVARIDSFLKYFLTDTTSFQNKEKLQNEISSALLHEALSYSLFNGGKRLRPLLVYATGEALNVPIEKLHAPSAAVEFIHCFSLVHDDLPSMDNDDFRRGKPTCHKVYNEAIAILVGDALQSLSFELLSNATFNPISSDKQIKMIQALSKATGIHGMVGGQALDIELDKQQRNGSMQNRQDAQNMQDVLNTHDFLNTQDAQNVQKTQNTYSNPQQMHTTLTTLHQKKTGALITASILLGYYASEIEDSQLYSGLKKFGDLIGLAFQVQDDILDVEGSFESLGKTPGKDIKQEKLTFPSLLGLDQSKKYKQELYDAALDSLKTAGLDCKTSARLPQIAQYFIQRIK